ncbi:retrotransposon hot spot (RHS) protein, putative [Trypanosoma cruzi]|uniref:Retrotransposon hot spot (RHS) protein, putative n=1 Tax=Trypanosoma cruzi (strain CL Brener) TaxID=353153 RepID=Q4CXQ1_TRYCC|nr:retrotransposon hot spot (RHS) protein, putative [Trypanosoma cruzi]EAN85054.1 retrotransposon hot spot (RHS) protein, putative [Trypanosoma cruzi]|eukprot:XP_806905.1 retrotransposon hot spot (RHS) protein [Trypanosoma cruzi strain CL Brener]
MPGNQASAVPQGDRQRRARPESEDVTDQPAATQIRVEEARRPQWTISSTVEDILLEGSTNRTEMKLNDFLRSNLGEEWVVERNGNVTMGNFVQNPETFIKKKGLLHTIKASPSYPELERELEERKILLEAIYKLHHEGVFSLEQWRDYEGKDTVTPLARRNLNRVLTQLLREESREAEERAVREGHVGFALTTTIRDVLFRGRVRVKDMKLNDFLMMELEGRGILRANRNVLLRVFFSDPTSHIRDAGVLNEIRASGAYLRMEMAVREEMGLEEVARSLCENGVFSLEQWRDYEGKDTVTPLARRNLNRVLTQLLREERREAEERAVREGHVGFALTTTIRDVLFRGRVRVMDVKLNDFLMMELEGRGILRANRNVLLRVFFSDPTSHIRDAGVLNEIRASGAYLRMEMAVREEMGLEEVARSLCENGVFSLEQWRDYEGKDTVTPLARRNLNRVLTQLLREERREAEERAVREGHVGFALTTTIRDVLFRGRVRVKDMKLNDFLMMELEGRGILRANRNVLLRVFFSDPTSHIRDAGVLGEIQTTGAYAEMEMAVREEMGLEEVVRRLSENGVNSLAAWSLAAEEVKACVRDDTKISLNAALEEVRNPTTSSAPIYLEGEYESVYNARWHHVVEVPDGGGTVMKVEEGKPEQQWTYKAAGRTFEKDDGAQQSGAPRLRLMVLTSDKGWPYSWKWKEKESIHDCYVNCEVERVWQIVKKDLSEFLSPDDEPGFVPGRRVLIGTPGIGKSMNAGSYLLYQLLHYDAEQLPMVAYFIADRTFLFDKTTQVASVYKGDDSIFRIVSSFSGRGVKGYVIYDVAVKGKQPQIALPCEGWGMILLTSPNIKNFEWWASRRYAARIVINCPEESDVRAICAWMKHNRSPQEQAEYWKEVKEQMEKVGPILRFILNKTAYNDRFSEGESAVNKITASKAEHYANIGELNAFNDSEVSHKLVKVVRVRRDNIEWPLNVPISHHFESKIFSKLESEMRQFDFIFLVLSIWDYVIPYLLEKCAVSAFLNEDFLRAIRLKINELKLTGRPEPQECALLRYSNKTLTRKEEPPENPSNRIAIEYWVLYRPAAKNFPLLDGFFFVDSNPKIMVGLQITTASEHHTLTSTVKLFTEQLAAYFNDWEELSRDMSWEIVYVQHKDNKPLTDWQRCGPANPNNETNAEKEIAEFWKKKVYQYRVGVSADDIKQRVSSVENDQQGTSTN